MHFFLFWEHLISANQWRVHIEICTYTITSVFYYLKCSPPIPLVHHLISTSQSDSNDLHLASVPSYFSSLIRNWTICPNNIALLLLWLPFPSITPLLVTVRALHCLITYNYSWWPRGKDIYVGFIGLTATENRLFHPLFQFIEFVHKQK